MTQKQSIDQLIEKEFAEIERDQQILQGKFADFERYKEKRGETLQAETKLLHERFIKLKAKVKGQALIDRFFNNHVLG